MASDVTSNIINLLKSRAKDKSFIITSVILLILFIIIDNELSSENEDSMNDVSCHYEYEADALTPIEDLPISHNPIFFHETSCRGYLDSYEMCAIESAARQHSDWKIYVLFSGPVTAGNFNKRSFKMLKKYPNVQFARIRILDYTKNTPVEQLVHSGSLNRSQWKVEHTSQILRFVTLYKQGGVYMDLDFVVAKPISSLARNWVARESDTEIAAGILAFSRDSVGRDFAEEAIRELSTSFTESDWRNSGSGVVTRVLKKRCSTPHPSYMSAATCEGFEVYGPQFFYPVEWKNARSYFQKGDLNVQNAYTYHLWSHITRKFDVYIGSPYERLTKRYCPDTFKLYYSTGQ
ncbi:lactosylceramide 4-alpha-galactosyltransferase-like [Aricia agestis]|uniref:lactosylceramide 4-alpha-galactosyltransferase-like n=1 Tax=Aricia agestis TaxID=91739 RepID=UPI001C206462|nr:lactosylceramide 4-alpha-galactosyltransferase-like [Aricia agestis]